MSTNTTATTATAQISSPANVHYNVETPSTQQITITPHAPSER